MSSAEHARVQLSELVAGEGSKEYTDAGNFGRDLVAVSDKFDKVVMELRNVLDRGRPFFAKNRPPLEFMCGVFKRLRTIADTIDECRKIVDTGRAPLSFRSMIELQAVTRMLWASSQSGEVVTVKTSGKQFIAQAGTVFTMPDPKKDPETHEEFLAFLREKGFGHIIRPGVELSYKEVEAALSSLLERREEMYPPYPKYLKATTVPKLVMKELKE